MADNQQNTPPHAKLELNVTAHIQGNFGYAQVTIEGCKNCLAEAIAAHLHASPKFKELINQAIRLANDRKAQREN